MKINLGLIGTNFITEWLINGAKKVEDINISAIYSRSQEKATEFAEKFNIENTFTNLEEMAKSDKIDAIYIASPNFLHAEQSILFLNNKKHVLCEKAFASNSLEVEKMIQAARENKVVLMEAMKLTAFPNFKVIQDNIHRIGKVRKYFASFCQYSSRYDKYKQGEVLNAFKPELSNGALVDIGVYCIAPMVKLFGKPEEVKATGYMLESGVDGEGSIVFKYDDMTATVMYSKISNSYVPSEIQGEEGSIIIDKINTFKNIKLVLKNGETYDLSKEQETWDMCYELQEFASVIKNGQVESKINTLEFSKTVVEIMQEARKQIGVKYKAD